jgi:DNA polymerase-3 subunit epsilon
VKWAITGPLISLDTETTDKSPFEARVVDIAIVHVEPGKDARTDSALIDPGVEIPAEAEAVHGISTAQVQAEGKPPAEVLDLFVGDIALAMSNGIACVIQNAAYDLTVLQAECVRHGLPTLEDRLGRPVGPVVDPMVLDRRLIKYRRRVSATQGARQLKTLAQVYGVTWDDGQAHGASYDALIGARVTWRMGQWCSRTRQELAGMVLGPFDPPKPMHRNDIGRFLEIGGMSPDELHEAQVRWYAEQAQDLAMYWRREADQRLTDSGLDFPPGDEALHADERRTVLQEQAEELRAKANDISTEWPIRPLAVTS